MITIEKMQGIFEVAKPLPDIVDRDFEISDLCLDSLDVVELINECEEEFQISITDDLSPKFQGTLGELMDCLNDLCDRKTGCSE